MRNIAVSEWVFIIAVAFQLSGALLLIFNRSIISIQGKVNEAKEKETKVTGELITFGTTQPSEKEIKEDVWMNRIAFGLIAMGYIFSIWAELVNTSRWIIFLFVILTSIVALSISLLTLRKILKS